MSYDDIVVDLHGRRPRRRTRCRCCRHAGSTAARRVGADRHAGVVVAPAERAPRGPGPRLLRRLRVGPGRRPGYAEPPSVVVATFGVFDPAHAHRRSTSRPSAWRRATTCSRRGRKVPPRPWSLGGADGGRRRAGRSVARRPGRGRRAWAGHCSARCGACRVPTSPHGRLWRAAELVREHRGDGHLAAVVAAGIEHVAINVLTELWVGFGVGEYSATRGLEPRHGGHRRGVAGGAGARRRWCPDAGRPVAARRARGGHRPLAASS